MSATLREYDDCTRIYRAATLSQAIRDHNPAYKMKLKITGTAGKSNWIDISPREFARIKATLCRA